MFINNPVTAQGVWTNATRTLTADPATDAGAATLVWTHAARTLTADPATDAGAATFVWTHAARTLTADPATDAGAATLVWTHATRNLTDPYFGNLNFEEPATVAPVSNATQNVFGTYVQIVASLAHNVRKILVSVRGGTAQDFKLGFSTGGAGSEVDKSFLQKSFPSASGEVAGEITVDSTLHAKGSRLAVHVANIQAASANTYTVNVTLIEDNA